MFGKLNEKLSHFQHEKFITPHEPGNVSYRDNDLYTTNALSVTPTCGIISHLTNFISMKLFNLAGQIPFVSFCRPLQTAPLMKLVHQVVTESVDTDIMIDGHRTSQQTARSYQ